MRLNLAAITLLVACIAGCSAAKSTQNLTESKSIKFTDIKAKQIAFTFYSDHSIKLVDSETKIVATGIWDARDGVLVIMLGFTEFQKFKVLSCTKNSITFESANHEPHVHVIQEPGVA